MPYIGTTNADRAGRMFDRLARLIGAAPGRALTEDKVADKLLDACRIAAEASGASVVRPAGRQPAQNGYNDLVEIARASRLRVRRVALHDGWWRRCVGALIAWHGEHLQPVAIVPVSRRRYVMIEPETGRRRHVDAALAAELSSDAAMLYRSLPPRPVSWRDLLRFCLREARPDASRILLATVGIGALALAGPLIMEVLIDSVIPYDDLGALAMCVGALIAVALGVSAFHVVEGVAMLRLETALDRLLQAAIMDRLLRLPASFFRRYTVGDLADRAQGIEAVRQVMTGQTIGSLLSVTFSIFSLGLILYYDARLALIALGLTLVHAIVVVATSAVRLYHERRHSDLRGRVEGIVWQLVLAVAKLRVACGTVRAFAIWARHFAQQKRHFIASQRAANMLGAFEAAFPAASTLVIFAAAGSPSARQSALGLGEYLAVYVAVGQALAAMTAWANAIGEALVAAPHMTRIRPLLTDPLEVSEDRAGPGELSGAMEFEGVAFRYIPGSAPVLSDIGFRVATGEYVAIVGPSGAGKSTIFRLLLGFEAPDAGRILLDGKALHTLDVTAVRRQMGVVLQDAKINSGTLYENICGGVELPVDRTWEAAQHAGIEEDIRAMPMGMHTVINEGFTSLSGGQQQRLMIARALAHRPRILLLDEATSALDNHTQALVMASLGRLKLTRLVIAHRLSTVKDADRIIVLVGGKIVQTGTFDELCAAPGKFAELALRQLI
jgi:NHLM bacteriocin system ABC transporter ATP-binding protein